MFKSKRQIIFFILALALMGVIFYFSHQTAEVSTGQSDSIGLLIGRFLFSDFGMWDKALQLAFASEISHIVRKTAHATEYGILALFWFNAIFNKDSKLIKTGIVTVIICALYAASDEFHQLFIAGRSGKVGDVLIDTTGALTMTLICILVCCLYRKRKK